MSINNIKLYVPPPTVAEIGSAYARLALGVAHHVPGLINSYHGPADWQQAVEAEPPSLEMLQQQAVAVATAVQKSDLPRNRRERLLRAGRALLWLIRARAGERIIFSEQVRLLLDIQPESAGEAVFQTAHETLAALLPGDDPLPERWAAWQARYTLPVEQTLPLLQQALDYLQLPESWSLKLVLQAPSSLKVAVVKTEETAPVSYQAGQLRIAAHASLRTDRLYHLALEGVVGHILHQAAEQRYRAGQAEEAVQLKVGPGQVLAQGLPPALLSQLDLYPKAIPAILAQAHLPVVASDQLQAIHLAENALHWATANAALLLHAEGLRPRAVRRHLMANGLHTQEQAELILDEIIEPTRATHVFAPLIGGPLLTAWLAREGHTVAALLTDPPAPSTMMFEVRFGDS